MLRSAVEDADCVWTQIKALGSGIRKLGIFSSQEVFNTCSNKLGPVPTRSSIQVSNSTEELSQCKGHWSREKGCCLPGLPSPDRFVFHADLGKWVWIQARILGRGGGCTLCLSFLDPFGGQINYDPRVPPLRSDPVENFWNQFFHRIIFALCTRHAVCFLLGWFREDLRGNLRNL